MSSATEDNITEEYHLWLKIEISGDAFDKLIRSATNTTDSQDILVMRGFAANNLPHKDTSNIGLQPLLNKYIIFSSDSARQLPDDEYLLNPRTGFDRINYQTQFYINPDSSGNLTTIYIHLESNIKARNSLMMLSLTLTHLKNNTAIASKTLPLFYY